MRLFSRLAFASALLLAAPLSAELPVSPLGDVYESYNDCFKVATKDGIKPEVLGGLGWSRAKTSGGKAVASQPIIYGHSTRKAIMLLSAASGEGLCIVTARLESSKTFEEFKSAWGGKLPAPDKEGSISFFAEGHAILLKQTGNAQTPSMMIAVMTPTEKK